MSGESTTGSRGPDFLIIGAMKAGTTSLLSYCGRHPDIHITAQKELHFFSDPHFERGDFDTYCEAFRSSRAVAGSAPQDYAKVHLPRCREVPRRIHERLPQVKLVYLVRDPIDRIVSHHMESVAGGHSPDRSLAEELAQGPLADHHYVLTSCYARQLDAFAAYVPDDRILVMDSHALREDRLASMNRLFRFLGVETLDDPATFEFELNTHATKHRRHGLLRWGLRSPWLRPLRAIVPSRLRARVRTGLRDHPGFLGRAVSRPELPSELRDRLTELLRSDADQLRARTGLTFPTWSV